MRLACIFLAPKENVMTQYYWQRLEKGAQSEIDYVIEQNQHIIPVEVKAGTRGSMQSLRIFMNLKHPSFGIRTCLENFGCYDNIKVVPLYAISFAVTT